MSLLSIHPDRLRMCFAGPVSTEHLTTLLNTPRFADRIEAIALRHYTLEPVDVTGLSAEDRALIGCTPDQLATLAQRTGVVMHALGFVAEIRGPVIAVLQETFGESAFHDARKYRDLAQLQPPLDTLEALIQTVSRDGAASLGAWMNGLPAPIRHRIALGWPADDAVPCAISGTDDRGVPILRRLALDMDGIS